jgi:hypothetical protein
LKARRRALAAGTTLAGATLAACSLIAGIDDLPLRDAGAADVAPPDATADAAPEACSTDPSLGCAAGCAHDFCDDFDLDGQTPATLWPGIKAGLGSPFINGASTVDIADGGRSPPSALLASTAGDASRSSYAVLVKQLQRDGAAPLGLFRYGLDFDLGGIAFDDNRGPIDGGGAASVAAIVVPQVPTPGVAFLLSTDGLYVAAADDIVGGTGSAIVERVYPIHITDIRGYVRVELVVGTADHAVAAGFGKCSGKTGGVVVGNLPSLSGAYACIALPSKLADLTWIDAPVILSGGLIFGPGFFDVRTDNVTADFLPAK